MLELAAARARRRSECVEISRSPHRARGSAARPPQLSDFRLEEAALPEPGAGEVLLRVLYLSLDPYMRGRMNAGRSYAKPVELGEVMTGEAIAAVLASNHPEYHEGDVVLAGTGWRTHAALNGSALRKIDPSRAPLTTRLGVLGMPGFTAYGGLHAIGKPQPGETVAVAAASGPGLARGPTREDRRRPQRRHRRRPESAPTGSRRGSSSTSPSSASRSAVITCCTTARSTSRSKARVSKSSSATTSRPRAATSCPRATVRNSRRPLAPRQRGTGSSRRG